MITIPFNIPPLDHQVTVNVDDINDTPPVFPLDYYGPYSFFEGVSGTYIGTFVASDSDSGLGGEITYTLIGNLSSKFLFPSFFLLYSDSNETKGRSDLKETLLGSRRQTTN